MISIENRQLFAKAEEKARQVKPLVSTIEFGVFVVWGKETNYTVEFGKDNAGHWQASCTCKAHTATSTPKPCYHLPAAYQAFKVQVSTRKQVRTFEAGLVPSISDWTHAQEAA